MQAVKYMTISSCYRNSTQIVLLIILLAALCLLGSHAELSRSNKNHINMNDNFPLKKFKFSRCLYFQFHFTISL